MVERLYIFDVGGTTMSWTLQRQPQKIAKLSSSRLLLKTLCILALTAAILGSAVVTYRARAAQAPSTTTGNFLVDQDHGLQFSDNKQNEPAITRDPLTGVLIAGANDEIKEPLCPGTTTPLATPSPFAPPVPIPAYYPPPHTSPTSTGASPPP